VTLHGVIFEIFTKLAYLENHHKVFLYSKIIIIYFSLFTSQTGLQMLQHSLLFSHEKYSQSKLVLLFLELASKLETTTETVSETISETSFFREKNAKKTKARTFVILGLFQLLHQ
jgi:hypothetical protein